MRGTEKTYHTAAVLSCHSHCPCDNCNGKAVSRATEYRHWRDATLNSNISVHVDGDGGSGDGGGDGGSGDEDGDGGSGDDWGWWEW